MLSNENFCIFTQRNDRGCPPLFRDRGGIFTIIDFKSFNCIQHTVFQLYIINYL